MYGCCYDVYDVDRIKLEVRRATIIECAEIANGTIERYENDHGNVILVYGKNSAQAILDRL